MQTDARASIFQRYQCRPRSWMIVTNLDRAFDGALPASPGGASFREPGVAGAPPSVCGKCDGIILAWRNPIHAIDFELFHQQIFRLTNNYAVRFRIKIDDITRLRRPARQAFALANRKHLNPVMNGDKVTVEIVNFAAMKLVLAKMRTQNSFVILAR